MAEDKNPEGSLPGIITCPNCGHEQTHQKSIEVFSREEDKKEVEKHTPLRSKYIYKEDNIPEYPSA